MAFPLVSNKNLTVTVQVWGPVNDPAGGGWGWFPIARIESPESTDLLVLREQALALISQLEQKYHATGSGLWPSFRATNIARLEFRSNGRVTARATLTDLW